MRVQTSSVEFHCVKINSIPSNIPSPSESGLFGSVVSPVKFICSLEIKSPKDNAESAPIQGTGVISPETLIKKNWGDEIELLISLEFAEIVLYSSQLFIPSPSKSSRLSFSLTGFKDHFCSKRLHLE